MTTHLKKKMAKTKEWTILQLKQKMEKQQYFFEPFGYYRCLRQLYSLIVSAWEASPQGSSIFPNRMMIEITERTTRIL